MATWPENIIIRKDDYKETPPDNVRRSNMDIGPDKLRKITSSNVRKISLKLFLDDTSLDVLDEFYLDNAALAFAFPNPRTDSTVQARFVSPPDYTQNENNWDVSLQLEILP